MFFFFLDLKKAEIDGEVEAQADTKITGKEKMILRGNIVKEMYNNLTEKQNSKLKKKFEKASEIYKTDIDDFYKNLSEEDQCKYDR